MMKVEKETFSRKCGVFFLSMRNRWGLGWVFNEKLLIDF